MTIYIRTQMTARVPFWMQNARRKEKPEDMERHNYRKNPPLADDHPILFDGTLCPACQKDSRQVTSQLSLPWVRGRIRKKDRGAAQV